MIFDDSTYPQVPVIIPTLPEVVISSPKEEVERQRNKEELLQIISSLMDFPSMFKLPVRDRKTNNINVELSKTLKRDLKKFREQLLQEALLARLAFSPLSLYRPVIETLPYSRGSEDTLRDFYRYINNTI